MLLLKSTKPNQLLPDKRGNLEHLAIEDKNYGLWNSTSSVISYFLFWLLL